MSKAARFNIFYQGRLYRKNLTAAEITKEFGCKSAMVYQAANTGHKINRVFEVKKIYPENEKNLENINKASIPDNFDEEWRRCTEVFKNVIWVKSIRLCGGCTGEGPGSEPLSGG